MKFWQLVSLLRHHPEALESTLSNPEWCEYGRWYEDFDAIVTAQDRDKLDAPLPGPLVEQSLGAVSVEVFRGDGNLFSARRQESDAALSILQAYELYGGAKLEDVFEHGSVEI